MGMIYIYRLLELIRIIHWVKNFLIFIPLLAANLHNDTQLLFSVSLGFLAFCLCSSAVYCFNDYIDAESDKLHPTKRNRPLARGDVSNAVALSLCCVLLVTSALISFQLSINFLFLLIGYFVLSLLYTLFLKKIVILDVIILTILYNFRIFSGCDLAIISPSFWLVSFALFLFFSLALVKRYVDLTADYSVGEKASSSKIYMKEDAPIICILGVSSALLSILIFALYLNSPMVFALYNSDKILWLNIPVLLFWVCWVWLKAFRQKMPGDPIVFAVNDRVSLSAFIIVVTTFVLARY